MKRIITTSIVFALLMAVSVARAEKMTLKTTYPPSIGIYSTIRLVPLEANLPSCNFPDTDIGKFYLDNSDGNPATPAILRYCMLDKTDSSIKWKEITPGGEASQWDYDASGYVYPKNNDDFIKVGTINLEFMLNIGDSGGIIARGDSSSASIAGTTAEGAGTKLLWYPIKGAFRAGRLDAGASTFWDDNKIGDYSVAFGHNTKAIGNYTVVGGGIDNLVFYPYSTIGGGYSNQANADYSTIGGGYDNETNGMYATVGGGSQNNADGQYSFVGGGLDNAAIDDYSVIGGGANNTANGQYSSIGGGKGNTANENYTTIGGGLDNTASGLHSTVGGGGYYDTSTSTSYPNTASGIASFVGGGADNTASGTHSVVAGGWSNTASGPYSVVSGGRNNAASGDHAVVIGGSNNQVLGNYSFVAGGTGNVAEGDYSWVGGQNMWLGPNADHTFLWGHSSSAPASYTVDEPDLFVILSDVVGIQTVTPNPAYKLDVNGDINVSGDFWSDAAAGPMNHPDYVFEPDYDLMPIDELREFVAKRKHLPNIPSAKEVQEKKVGLFEEHRLLLEKTEETFLYILELDERLARLEEKITTLE